MYFNRRKKEDLTCQFIACLNSQFLIKLQMVRLWMVSNIRHLNRFTIYFLEKSDKDFQFLTILVLF